MVTRTYTRTSLVPFNLVELGQQPAEGLRALHFFLSLLGMPECLLAYWQDTEQEQELTLANRKTGLSSFKTLHRKDEE